MKISLLAFLLPVGHLFQAGLPSSWVVATAKSSNTANQFFHFDYSADYLITGNILEVEESPYIDDANTMEWTCFLLVDKTVRNKAADFQNPAVIKTGDTISFSFTTSKDYPSNADRIKVGKNLMFLIKNSENHNHVFQLVESSGSIFKMDEDLIRACKNSIWAIDSSKYYSGTIEQLRFVKTTTENLNKIFFSFQAFNKDNRLIYEEKKIFRKNKDDIFEIKILTTPNKFYIPSKITETWYDNNGNVLRTVERDDYMAKKEPAN